MSDVTHSLEDLLKQATVERSRFYVGSVCIAAIAELSRLNAKISELEKDKHRMDWVEKRPVDGGRNGFITIPTQIKIADKNCPWCMDGESDGTCSCIYKNVGIRKYIDAQLSQKQSINELGKSVESQCGWLVEAARDDGPQRYRTMDEAGIDWTTNPSQAIRFARREDAEMFAAGDEDAWHIVEHMFIDSNVPGNK